MPWNYRVTKEDNCGETYSIQEVYYDSAGAITGYGGASVTDWASVEDLRATLNQMLLALDRPVIDYKDEEEG